MARLPMVTGLALIALIHVTMSFSVQEYFPEINNNLTKIKWAHATNSKAALAQALNSSEIMMIEADVDMGYEILENGSTSNEKVPIMVHPPSNRSDLTLSAFWKTVKNHNNNKDNKTKKGIKLDFKDIQAYTECLIMIPKEREAFKGPIFFNADILKGPVNADTKPLDATHFLNSAKQALTESEHALSIGWTTKYVAPIGNATISGNYTIEQINEMTKLVNGTKLSITYPVRACYAAGSLDVLKTLLADTPAQNNATLTIWSHEGDVVDANKLSELIRTIGISKVFVDVPKSLFDKLDVNSAFTASSSVFVVFASMIIALFSAKLL